MPTDDELRTRVREIVLRVLSEESDQGPNPRSVALGADHGGLELKQNLAPFLSQLGYKLTDCGTFTPDPVDYPDVAYAVARLVGEGVVARGIIVDGAGIGSCMVANKVPGVRAALCYDETTARNAREHNDANVLTLGGRLIQAQTAREIARIFLETNCTEPRHQKRVRKIMEVERRYLRK
jgi:RpiB/LacA/LacB family sugar-phosphate isomerase